MNIKYIKSFEYSTKILLRTLDYLYNLDKNSLLQKIDVYHINNSQEYRILNRKCLSHKFSSKLKAMTKRITIKQISFNVQSHYYFEFTQFKNDLDLLFQQNIQLFKEQNHLYSLFPKQDISQFKKWFQQLIQIQQFFNSQINLNNIAQKYNQALHDDLQLLFKQYPYYKCQGINQRKEVYNGRLTLNKTQIKQIFTQNYSLYNNKSNFSIQFYNNSFQTLILNQDQQVLSKIPFPENYPLLEEYQQQNLKNNITNRDSLRKSFKRPSSNCTFQCQCFKKSGKQCANSFTKVECLHHSCSNSQIREKKDVQCWYLDEDKNLNKQKKIQKIYEQGYQLKQEHSYGIDLYTINILWNLMPTSRYFYIDNQKQKTQIIEQLIVKQINKSQSLFQAIYNLSGNINVRQYHFQLKNLQRKLKYINNYFLFTEGNNFIKSAVKPLKSYYKGLGIFNCGTTIPKHKFIANFAGQVIQPWRDQQRQQISLKVSKFGYKNQDPSHIKFYCISVLSHYDQPLGIKCFSIDPQNKGNFCRSLNHSCNPNCKSQVIVSQGKYYLAIYSIRQINPDQELTFDYMSITDNIQQFNKSQCLCAKIQCKGRFLTYQQQINLNIDKQFLKQNYSIEQRLISLMQACIFDKTNQNQKKIKKLKSLKILFPFQNQCIWMTKWIINTFEMIQEQIKFCRNKRKQLQQKSEFIIFFDENINLQHRVLILNNRIKKIQILLSTISDYQSPFYLNDREFVINFLQNNLNKKRDKEQNLCISKQNLQNLYISKVSEYKISLSQFTKQSLNLRLKLLQRAHLYFIQNDIKKCQYYLKLVFHFLDIKPHLYEDYISQPVKIWRQNQIQIQDNVFYKSQNLFIIQNLICWGQELKNIFKQREKQNCTVQLQKTLSIYFNNNQLNQIQLQSNKKKQILQEFMQKAISKIQEKIFKVLKPIQLTDITKISINSFEQLSRTLQKWVSAQFNFWKQIQLKQKNKKLNNKKKTSKIKKGQISVE